MRALTLTAAALLALTACASDPADYSTESSPTTETASAAEVCQTISDEMPSGGFPDPDEWQAFDTTLDEIEAPEELATPLSDLQQAVQSLADGPSSTDLLDARADLRAALDDLDTECQAAGSDALQ